jgi:hypothetical protein
MIKFAISDLKTKIMSGNFLLISTRNFFEGYGMEIKTKFDGKMTVTAFDFKNIETVPNAIRAISDSITRSVEGKPIKEVLLMVLFRVYCLDSRI